MAYLLVAEDNPVERMVVRAILAKAGHQVFLAEDGEEARELFDQLAVDLAVIDLQMPGIDGFELIESYRASGLAYAACTPILAISADNEEETGQRARAAGATAWLSKPLGAGRLRETVARLLAEQTDEEPPQCRPISPRSEARTLNEQSLRELAATVSDRRFLPALLERFVHDASEHFAAMRKMLRDQDWGALRETAHALQGAAGSVGGERLALGARCLRLAGDDELARGGEAKLLSMQTEFARLRVRLEDFTQGIKGKPGSRIG